MLCYALGILSGIVFLFLAPYNTNRRIRFHAFQAIFYTAAAMGLSIVFSIVGIILAAILGPVASIESMVVMAGLLGGWVYMMWQTYQGKTVVLPVIGRLAQQFSSR